MLIDGSGGLTTGIAIDANSDHTRIRDNTFWETVTTKISNSGTDTKASGNNGATDI
jgi:hypothetical protein